MSIVHVRQIQKHLDENFRAYIDVSDCRPEQSEQHFLSRALAAYVVVQLCGVSQMEASQTITDGFGDNGIDAIHFDTTNRVLYCVQTKWSSDGSGSVSRGDTQKFIQGIKDLINARFNRFNEKVQAKSTSILDALDSAGTHIQAVLAYSGQGNLGSDIRRDFNDLLAEINDSDDVLSFRDFRQDAIYRQLVAKSAGKPIELELGLLNWGKHVEPFEAYYGEVDASEIAAWYAQHHHLLLTPNIRMFLGTTQVNESITSTLQSNPQMFWYFNNGITILCDSIKRKPLAANTNSVGYFVCSGVSIVNGAQTVGAIHSVSTKNPEKLTEAKVQVRLISLQDCPESFSADVTRATNTQNRIERQDWVALDPNQETLRTQLHLDGVEYVYKAGAQLVHPEMGFKVDEAAIALCCASEEMSYVVIAKSALWRIWDDLKKPPYAELFTPHLDGRTLWLLVRTLRHIDQNLRGQLMSREGKERLLIVHGNRFIAHQIFRTFSIDQLFNIDGRLNGGVIDTGIDQFISSILEKINEEFPNSYLGNLFKNTTKCRRIHALLHQS